MFGLKRFFAAFAGSIIMTVSFAHAENGAWRIIEMDGAVRTSQPTAGVQLVSTGGAISAGAVVSTGINGRVVLARGEQQIVIGPSSRMSLPAVEDAGMTRILQDLGTLLFKVDKRNTQHFRVETPVIAAVVKGTTFTVTAGADAHVVHVAEGAVEVSAVSGAARQLVTPGMTVYVSRNDPTVIRVGAASDDNFGGARGRDREAGDVPADRGRSGGEKHALTVPSDIGGAPLDYANLTDGLIDGDARNAQSAAQASFGQSRAAAGSGNGANRAAAIRQIAISNAGANRAGAGNDNGNAGNANGAANAGNANGNGNAGNANGAASAGNANVNGAGAVNGAANPGNPNGNGNAGNANGAASVGNVNVNGAGARNGTANAGNANGNAGNVKGNRSGNGNRHNDRR